MNWVQALRETVLEFDGLPPEWGKTDCCQFVNSYHEKVTGKRFDFPYDSHTGALRIIREHGSLQALLTSLLGDPSPTHTPGDIVLQRALEAPGVYNGFYVFCIHPDLGVRYFPSDFEISWCLSV